MSAGVSVTEPSHSWRLRASFSWPSERSVWSLSSVILLRTLPTPLLCSLSDGGVMALVMLSMSVSYSSVPCTMLCPCVW